MQGKKRDELDSLAPWNGGTSALQITDCTRDRNNVVHEIEILAVHKMVVFEIVLLSVHEIKVLAAHAIEVLAVHEIEGYITNGRGHGL